MFDFFKKMLGNKSQRDIRGLNPLVEKSLAAWEKIRLLSHDELRAKTIEFRERISQYIAGKEQEIADLKAENEALKADEKANEEKEADEALKTAQDEATQAKAEV